MKIYRLVFVTICTGFAIASTGCGASDSGESTTSPASSTAPPTTTSSAAMCGIDLTSPVISAAIATLPPEPGTGARWSTNPAGFEGTYDPCVTLSTVIVTIEGATGSSPEQALLFHKGDYVGTATPESHGFTELDPSRTTDDTVGLSYKTPGSCNACPDGTVTQVQFHWDGKQVQMIGAPPK